MLPNDSKYYNFDSSTNGTCTSTTSVLLPSTTYDRTILWTKIDSKLAGDNAIGIQDGYNLIDSENAVSSQSWNYAVLPAGKNLTCYKTNVADHVSYSVVYVDRNLNTEKTSEISTNASIYLLIGIFCVLMFDFVRRSINRKVYYD